MDQRQAYKLISVATGSALADLCAQAAERRDKAWGKTLTYSPKVFLPTTNLCRNFCDYCSFRRSPGQAGEWTMTPDETRDWLARGAALGCSEALFCLGDTPESSFRSYANLLKSWGFASTVDYLYWSGQQALDVGVFPHTNAGILDKNAMAKLREVNVSMGLMLENISSRLCEKGMPHYRAKDKRPEVRLKMTREAGELKIPFTSGLLLGIGETRAERIDTLFAIRDLHRDYGHIQEVIVQNFRAKDSTPMFQKPEPSADDLAWTIAMARLILDDGVSVQAPPNLNTGETSTLVAAGINDFGGISPVTPDYINHKHPWPAIDYLRGECAVAGFNLQPRLPVYGNYIQQNWQDVSVLDRLQRHHQRAAA